MTTTPCRSCEKNGRVSVAVRGMATSDLEALVHQLYEFTLQHLPDGAAVEMERLVDAGLAELKSRRPAPLSGLKTGEVVLLQVGPNATISARVVSIEPHGRRVKVEPIEEKGGVAPHLSDARAGLRREVDE